MSRTKYIAKITACRQRSLPLAFFFVFLMGLTAFTHSGCQSESAAPLAGGVRQTPPQPAPQTQTSARAASVAEPDRPVLAATTPQVLAQAAAVEAKPSVLPPSPQPQKSAPPQAGKRAPKIKFEQSAIDFGKVSPGSKHVTQFKFSNIGDAVLNITNVKCCCGSSCKVSKNDYAPGESGALELEFYAPTEPVAISRQLSVSTNDPQNSEVTLTVSANVVRMVDVEPKRLSLVLKQANAGCSDITLTSLDGKSFSITGVQSSADAMKVDFDPAVRATKYLLKPTVNLEVLQKQLTGRLNITLTHPEAENIDLLFDVLPQFTLNPPQLIIFKVEPGKPIRRVIWVLSNYGGDFDLESVRSQNDILKVIKREKVGNRYQFEVEIIPPAAGDKSKLLSDVLLIKMKGGEELQVPCRGFYN